MLERQLGHGSSVNGLHYGGLNASISGQGFEIAPHRLTFVMTSVNGFFIFSVWTKPTILQAWPIRNFSSGFRGGLKTKPKSPWKSNKWAI